jgi:membrane protease YdiL (CAAX protease family)
VAATASGLTADDLGLRRDRLRGGLRLGSAVAGPVVAAFGLAALNPATRPLLNDQRIAGLDRRQLAYQVLLRIPVGTVAWEEIAFRGVLRAALRRVLAEPLASTVGAAVFGLWHIRPTAEALAVNRLAASRGARITAVAAVVVGTAGAGAVLSLLRERSGSLAAPVLLHLAANCAGPLASALARAETLAAATCRVTSDPISAWLVTIGLVATTRFWLDGSQAVVVARLSPRGPAAVRAVRAVPTLSPRTFGTVTCCTPHTRVRRLTQAVPGPKYSCAVTAQVPSDTAGSTATEEKSPNLCALPSVVVTETPVFTVVSWPSRFGRAPLRLVLGSDDLVEHPDLKQERRTAPEGNGLVSIDG